MDILLSFDTHKYQQEKRAYEQFIPEIQSVVDAFKALGLEDIKSEELGMLFIKTEELVFDKMTQQNTLSLNGMEVHKHEAMKLIKKPQGYENLLSLIKNTTARMENAVQHTAIDKFPLSHLNRTYELNSNCEVILKASKNEELQEHNKKYAKSDKAKKLTELANVIIEECKDPFLSQLISVYPNGLGALLNSILKSKHGEKGVTLNVDEIVRLNYND